MHIMKLLLSAAIVLFTLPGFTQVSSDSVNLLKQQKQSLALSSKINERKLQLAKLENSIPSKTQEAESTAKQAQEAANESADAAAKLTNDSQDKKLSKRARKSAQYAERCARKARNAADDLASLKKDIELLRNKIAEDETKLSANPVQP